MQYTAIGEKTAEERFHTLARGWLAYPVTPMHARLPPKSGCRNIIPRFAPSRRRATALFRNPVRKAQRSVPGFSSTPNSACRRYATSPPSIGLRIPIVRHNHHLIAPTAQYTAIGKTAEERFNMLARGWLAYPVTPTHHTSTAEERLYKRHPSVCPIGAIHRHRRNPIRTKRQRRAHGASAGTIYMRFGDALLRRPRKRSRLQLTPDRVGGTRTDAYAPRSAAAERSIAKCRKLGRR